MSSSGFSRWNMSDTQRLMDCVSRTLETMFYTAVEEVGDGSRQTPRVGRTEFRGSLDGRMAVGLDDRAADGLAASFLGLDAGELSDRDRDQVLGELANILCGSYLSAIDPEGRFELAAPEAASEEQVEREAWQERICLAIPEGLFRIWWAIEREQS